MRINIYISLLPLFLTEKAKDFWESYGHSVELFEVLSSGYNNVVNCDLLGVMYPVLASNFPDPITGFAKILIEDKTSQKKSFLYATVQALLGDGYWPFLEEKKYKKWSIK